MKRFKNILLVAGGEGWKEAALTRAVTLAKNNRARLTIVDIVEELPRDMRKCPCPVWVIKPAHRKKFARIMAAVDHDPVDKKRNALNSKIMELATSLARMAGRGFWWEISAATGYAGLSMMGIQFALTARFKHATAPFGIDIIYYFHKQAALMAFLFIALHVVFLAVASPQYVLSSLAPPYGLLDRMGRSGRHGMLRAHPCNLPRQEAAGDTV